MKNIIGLVVILVSAFVVCLYAGSVSDFDNGYSVSTKYNKCISVRNYPDKNVRPSYLLKKGCTIYKIDREHGALTLKCGREGYYYAKDYDVCIALLRRLKEVGSK